MTQGENDQQYLDVEFPAVFDLEVPLGDGSSEWVVDVGSLRPDMFDRLDDGTYLCAGYGGRPLYMRVVEQFDDGRIKCVDGGGEPFLWRIRAVR